MKQAVLIPGALAAFTLGAVAFAATEERLARLNVEETQLSAEQARNMSQLARLLSVLQQLRRDPPPALLVNPRDARDAVRAAILVKAMTPELQAVAVGYAREAGEMARQRRLAAVESEAMFTAQSEQADLASRAGDEPLLRGMQGPSPAEAAISAPQSLVSPAAGRVLRRYGEALSSGGHANGLTIAAPQGARVASPGAGTVQYAGPVKGWGVILILRLAGGYHLVLAGLDRTSVSVGQSVAAGEAVGWMADGRQSSGRQTTRELYLEVREQGSPVDPARWLKITAG
jgi:septal ring factor EnvC (AmiA/AmiB activator)